MSQEETIEQLQAENAQLKKEKEQTSAEKTQVQAEKAQVVEENRQLRELVEGLLKCLYGKMQETAENAELGVEKQHLQEQVEELSIQVRDLLGRVAKDSSNSSKPPSTDGYAKKTRSLRQSTGKKPGGQAGHLGTTRSFVETPDEVIIVREDEMRPLSDKSARGGSLRLRTTSKGG